MSAAPVLELSVSDSTYRDQEELLFRTAAQLKGVVFYRGLLLILLPAFAWLSSDGLSFPSVFYGVLLGHLGVNLLCIGFSYGGVCPSFRPAWLVVVDAACFTALAAMSGGVASYFVYCFFLLILYSTVWFDRSLSRGTGLLAAGCALSLAWFAPDAGGPGALTGVVVLALAALAMGTGEIAQLVAATRERSVRAVMDLIAAIGERKRADDALQRLNLELESRVQHRTQELAAANARLEEALDTLKRAQQELVRTEKLASLGSLVAGIAHELSTPLGNSLTVATTLADRTRTFAEEASGSQLRRSSLTDFVAQAQQASDLLVRSLLGASELIGRFKRVAVDQTSAQRRRFDLAQTLDEVVATLRPQIRKTPHRIEIAVARGLDMLSYPGPLGQVIINLVNNALVHGFEGAAAGIVRIEAAPEAADRVRVTVVDNGRGIPEADHSRIFDPFFTTRLGQGGSGLGLHIVFNIVTRVLGGQISVTSRPGEGAAFVLELPLVAPQSAAENPSGSLAVESESIE
jgi:signal transduction histidine kinase